jgi:hypothetical protein
MTCPIWVFLLAFDFTQKLYAYLLMLLAMSFNGWVLMSVCLGLTVGYAYEQMKLEYKINLRIAHGKKVDPKKSYML